MPTGEQQYIEFFLNSDNRVVQLETIEINHSVFDHGFFLVRNNTEGMVAPLREGGLDVTFSYCPMEIRLKDNRSDLDYGLTIQLGDTGDTVTEIIDQIRDADLMDEKPILRYRSYRSDDLTEPMFGPIELEVSSFSFTSGGVEFDADAPTLNTHSTGVIYRLGDFPTLAGFL